MNYEKIEITETEDKYYFKVHLTKYISCSTSHKKILKSIHPDGTIEMKTRSVGDALDFCLRLLKEYTIVRKGQLPGVYHTDAPIIVPDAFIRKR